MLTYKDMQGFINENEDIQEIYEYVASGHFEVEFTNGYKSELMTIFELEEWFNERGWL